MGRERVNAEAQAYAKVNGISVDEVLNSEYHKNRCKSAIQDVAYRQALYPGESKSHSMYRIGMQTPEAGMPEEIASYFKRELPDENLGTLSPFEIIFTMQKRYFPQEVQDTEEEVTVAATDINEHRMNEESTSSSDKNNILKEDSKMESTSNFEATQQKEMEEMNQIASGASAVLGDEVPKTLPEPADNQANMQASKKVFANEKAMRAANTANWVITGIILGKRPPADIIVGEKAEGSDDLKAFGTIKNPKNVLSKITKYIGSIEGMEKVPPAFKADAKAVYDAVSEAVNDPSKQFKVFVGKGGQDIKGVFIKKGSDSAEPVKKAQLMLDMVNSTLGRVTTSVSGVEFQLKSVTPKATSTAQSKGSGSNKHSKKNTDNPLKGIAQVRVSGDKSDREGIISYYKDIDRTKTKDVENGRSELCFKYYAVDNQGNIKKNDKGESVVRTYRIPLVVKQYSQVADTALVNVWPESNSRGLAIVAATTEEDRVALEKEVQSILASSLNVDTTAARTGALADVQRMMTEIANAAFNSAREEAASSGM